MAQSVTRSVTAILFMVAASGAAAQEWSRSGPNGSVTRTHTEGSGLSISRSGARGGSTSGTVSCSGGSGVSCQRDFSATGPDGQTVTGQRETFRRPWRSTTTLTGPAGETVTRVGKPRRGVWPRVRRIWRR